MRGLSVREAAEIVCGELHGTKNSDSEILGVTIDSRKVENGYMFAALKGEHADGHDYIGKAFELGAVCCIAERLPDNADGTVILVADVAAALKTLAENYRKRFDIPVIGIAGSVGKTTAKEMIASVLSQKYNVLKTEKNLNNELGVPLTIFRIEPEHEAAVIEMGISDFGEMSRLAKMVRPTMAVYTLIGHAHLERLHDRNGVLKAKTEMLDYISDDGVVFLNADDDLLAGLNCRQSKVCILGDMLEMGENKEKLHAKVGKYASDNGVDMLLTVGELSKNTCTAAEKISSLHFDTNAKLISRLPELIKKGDTVLVKASHSMKFDEISDALKLLK